MLVDDGLTLKYKTYTIKSRDDALQNEKKTYVKPRIWHLGDRKKQKSAFLPLLGTIARSLLASVAAALLLKLLENVSKKYFGLEKEEEELGD